MARTTPTTMKIMQQMQKRGASVSEENNNIDEGNAYGGKWHRSALPASSFKSQPATQSLSRFQVMSQLQEMESSADQLGRDADRRLSKLSNPSDAVKKAIDGLHQFRAGLNALHAVAKASDTSVSDQLDSPKPAAPAV